MLLSDKVRRDLEREVLGNEFGIFYRERLRRGGVLDAFEHPEALLEFLRGQRTERSARDAVLAELLRAHRAATEDRARIAMLVLLAIWRDVRSIVLGKTSQLVRRAGFGRSDADDIEHDLVLDLLGRLPHYDPQRASLRTFLTRIIDHRVATVLEERSAARRDWRRCMESLDDDVEDGGDDDVGQTTPRHETLDPGECAARRGIGRSRSEHVADLRLDVHAAIEALPPDLRALAHELLRGSPAEAARALGMADSTARDAIARIRRAFTRSGLADFLKTARDPAADFGT